MLLAGVDTSAAAIEWTMSEFIRRPKEMKKLGKELEEKVGEIKWWKNVISLASSTLIVSSRNL